MTALMWAARTGYLAFVVTLAELGANVNAEDFVIFDLLYKRVLAIILTCISSTLFFFLLASCNRTAIRHSSSRQHTGTWVL